MCLAFISLLIVCSASWFIKSLTDGLYQWPKKQTAESRKEYIENIAEDTSDYFTTGGVYKGMESAAQEPTITAKGAQELYGYTKNEGEKDPDFLERISNPDYNEDGKGPITKKYSVVWEAGLYFNLTDDQNNKREIIAGEQGEYLHGKVAGTHYYRIIDTDTQSVICYKHKVTIEQDTLDAPAVTEPSTPLFAYDNIKYGASWSGTESSDVFVIDDVTVNVADFMAIEKKAFGNSHFLSSTKELTLQNSDANKELLQNNFSNASDESVATATVHYTFLATAYSSVGAEEKTYYGTIVEALEATDNIDANGAPITDAAKMEAQAGTNVVALQTVSYSYTYTDADGVEQTKEYKYPHGKKVDNVGYTHMIDKDCVVGANVTLIIPYDENMDYYDLANNKYTFERVSGTYTDTDGKSKGYRSALETEKPLNYIEVDANRTLENRGNIIIPGVINGGSGGHTQNSVTTGNHSQIILGSRATLVGTSGNITCYGHIIEKGYQNKSKVEMTGGNIDMVLTIAEHRGGTAFSGLINITKATGLAATMVSTPKIMESSPFNRFYVESVTTDLIVHEGATAGGLGYMVVADYAVEKRMGMFGTEAEDFLQFVTTDEDDGRKTKVTFRYDTKKKQNQMSIEGSVTVNELKIEVSINVTIGTVDGNMNTSGVFLPLSHYWNISFNHYPSEHGYDDVSATVDAQGQDIKIMPGASVTIGEAVTLKAKYIAVYKKDANIPTVGNFDYYAKSGDDLNTSFDKTNPTINLYDTYTDGKFVVNGYVEALGIGGFIDTSGANGKVLCKTANQVNSKEVASGELLKGTYVDNSLTANGNIATDDDGNTSLTNIEAKYTYQSLGTAWLQPFATITFDAQGGTPETLEYIVDVTQDGMAAEDVAEVIAKAKVAKDGYAFVGWQFSDGTLFDASTAYRVKYDTTLSAKWNKKITIVFDVNGGDSTVASKAVAILAGGGISEADFTAIKNTGAFKAGYELDYWSTTADGGEEISAAWFTSDRVENDQITIYAQWKETTGYRVIHNANGQTITFTDGIIKLGVQYTGMPKSADGIDDSYTESRYLLGWSKDPNATKPDDSIVIEEADLKTAADGTKYYELYAVWGYKIKLTLDVTGNVLGLTNDPSVYVIPGQTYAFSDFANYSSLKNGDADGNAYSKYFIGFTYNGCTLLQDKAFTVQLGETETSIVTENREASVAVVWGFKYKLTLTPDNSTIEGATTGTYYKPGAVIDLEFSTTEDYSIDSVEITAGNEFATLAWTVDKVTGTLTFTDTVPSDEKTVTITVDTTKVSSGGGCFVEGTLITLADGTQKRVEDLTSGDVLLVFNHVTGKFEAQKLFFTAHKNDPAALHRVLTLEFSNGESIRIAANHGFFDLTLNKYIYIDEFNVDEYIGHKFYSAKYVDGKLVEEEITLVNSFVTEEFVKVYSPVSEYTFNCFADNMLTVTPFYIYDGFANIFDYGEGMKYDEAQMAQDIEKYGLYTYEEFAEYYTYEQFIKAGTPYFKVAVGKGYITFEEMLSIIDYLKNQELLE